MRTSITLKEKTAAVDVAATLNTYVAVHFNTAVQRAISAFMDNMRGVSMHALRKGIRSIG